MANSAIERLKKVGMAGQQLGEILKYVALAQNLMTMGKNIGGDVGQQMIERAQSYFNAINSSLDKLNSIKTDYSPKTDKSSSDKVDREKESLNLLEQYNKKIEETKKGIEEINKLLESTTLRPDEILYLLESKAKLQKELETFNLKQTKGEVKSDSDIEKVEENKKKMKTLAELFGDKLKSELDKSISIASQIQNIFQTGGHTVLGKFLAALQVTQQIVALLESLNLAQGIFSLIGKIFGIALAPATGGASLAGTTGGMPYSGGNNMLEKFSSAFNYLNKNSGTAVSKVPYFVSLEANGRKLKAVIREVDKIDNSRLK